MMSFKTTMIGKSTVGKTSIVIRMVHGHCNEKVATTVGVSFMTYTNEENKF